MEESRPTPVLEDIDGTRRKLAQWFSAQRGYPIEIPELTIPDGNGMSNVTLLFDIQWQQGEETRTQSCVGRLQPEIDRPVFPSYALEPQYRVMEALGHQGQIPVPELLGLETDTRLLGVEFYIMGRIDGQVPSDMPPYNMDGWLLNDTSEEQRATLWRSAVDMLARFHQLDSDALDLPELQLPPGKTALQAQLDYWQQYHDWGLEGRTHEIGQRALDWLRANQPQDEPTALCWGDSRVGNMMFAPSLDEVVAVLDWEMAVAGNPVQDLAWFNYIDATFAEGLGFPRLPGLPSYEDTVAQWEAATGRSAEHYDYYWIFAGMRYGLIMSRIMLATGQEHEIQGNFVCKMLEKYLDELT
ncbi:phosphotransferase family protein [Parahaliea maris]|uniref:Phosphotransferase family protein n=1 Tax=Parahaliea maris TaxID=2716870 RepID=A0A5C9A2T6_9GAMM|nr:phosphotransferase family protein [Parahaliea maris]TXS94262.1 phosphotransferase family protein [Parahaliea maris]